jgi:hypothetical protein
MGLDTIFGLPVHPLVVHLVVVLLPLAALGTIAIAVRFPWRQRYGTLVGFFAMAATLAVPLASQSGEAFAGRVGLPVRHAQLAENVKFAVIPWIGLVLVMLWWSRAGEASRGYPAQRWFTAVRVGVVLLSIACLITITLAGHSGAQAVWTKIIQNTTPAAGG